MDILVKYSLEILYKDYALYVPSPFAYILHKLIINKKRKSYKQEKDADAVRNLFDAISDEEKNSLKIVFNTDITTKERKAVLEACDKFKELLLPISKFLQS